MAASQDVFSSILVTFSFAVLIGVVVFRFFGKYLPVPRRLRVPPFQVGVFLLEDKQGHDKPERIVGPGTYWVTPKRNILTCDTRPTSYKLSPEDFLTSDNFRPSHWAHRQVPHHRPRRVSHRKLKRHRRLLPRAHRRHPHRRP